MRKDQYIQAFELLTAIFFRYEKDSEKGAEFLYQVAGSLQGKIKDDLISEILTLSGDDLPSKDIHDTDRLFISYSDLDLIYTNLDILDLKERLILYACIASWFDKFNFSLSDENLLEKILNLRDEHIEIIDDFLSTKVKDKVLGNNVIFLLHPYKNEDDDLEGKWIESNRPREQESNEYFEFENLRETLKILFCDDLKLFFISTSDCKEHLRKRDQKYLSSWETIEPGESIHLEDDFIIDYYTLKKRFLHEKYSSPVHLTVRGLSYHYPNGKGIQTIDFEVAQGAIIGILGKEGAGKTTFLKLLAGELAAHKGTIDINGYEMNKELYHLKGLLGFVPEDDLLFDELSVYDNVYLAAKLYHVQLSDNDIKQKTADLLSELDLYEYKNVVVGSPFEKKLQPGQRRLLNIAVEMIRDPKILIVDNGIASLSPVESDKVIEILSRYTFKGGIVITSIAQSSGKTLNFFDEIIVLDEGGLPIYSGKSTEVYAYFYDLFKINPIHSEISYGADELLDLINARKNTTRGYGERYYSPWELNAFYLEKTRSRRIVIHDRRTLPSYFTQPPTLDRQYILFGIRNFKIKLSKSRDVLFTLIASPLLALILSLIFRQSNSKVYSFYHNGNIPVFFFLSILAAIFSGLIQSSDEILKEKSIYIKQEYHNLSRFSYINSKITYLFIIGLLQSFLFVLIGVVVLQIRNIFFLYWLVIFSSMAFGLLTGLLFSSLHHTLITILSKSIPIVMILQIIYGGLFIDLRSLGFSKKNYTPILSDIAVTRWAYETLLVYQFKNNKYEKIYYNTDRKISNAKFNASTFVPLLKNELKDCDHNLKEHPDSVKILLNSIRINLDNLQRYADVFPYGNMDKLNPNNFTKSISSDLKEYLEYLELQFYSQWENMIRQRKLITDSLHKTDPLANIDQLKELYQNKSINQLVRDTTSEKKFQYSRGMIIQLSDPIFQYPVSEVGRAPLFLPEKKFKGQTINTAEFDISVIWMINLVLYILLITDLLKKFTFSTKIY